MSIEPTRDEGQRLSPPNGRVIGTVSTKSELDECVSTLHTSGFEEVEVLYGPDGIELMTRLRGVFFLGEEEANVIDRNISELKKGHYVIAVNTPSHSAKQVAEIATSHGVRSLTHFGMWVNTRLT